MHLQAITTKFLGPTNTRGSRVVARAAAGRLTIAWDHRLSAEGNHKAAAEALAKRLNWRGTYAGGTLPDGGSVFVRALDVHSADFAIKTEG